MPRPSGCCHLVVGRSGSSGKFLNDRLGNLSFKLLLSCLASIRRPAPAEDFCTVVANDFYALSERAVDCQHFSKSNRKARTFDAKPRYKSSRCQNIIKELSEVVLFQCTPCGGERSYHVNCLMKSLATSTNVLHDDVVKRIGDHAYSDTVTDLLRFAADVNVCPVIHSTRLLRERKNLRTPVKP